MNIFRKVSQILADNGALKECDIEVCSYGLEVMFSTVIEFASIFLVSLILGNFMETLIFFAAFVPLRIYAGGYHADTKLRCFAISLAVYGAFTLIMKNLSITDLLPVSLISVLLTVASVVVFAPIIHKNRNINETEKHKYRELSLLIMAVEVIVTFILLIGLKQIVIGASFSLGQAAVAFSMLAAIIKKAVN